MNPLVIGLKIEQFQYPQKGTLWHVYLAHWSTLKTCISIVSLHDTAVDYVCM